MAATDKNIELIEKQCYEWLAIMSSDCRTAEEVNRFELWLAADEEHRRVYKDVENVWQGLAQLEGMIDPASYQDIATPGVWEKITLALGLRPALVAASVCSVFLAVMAGFYLLDPMLYRNDSDDFSTRTAEVREFTLHDESVVTLGAQSAIEVDYSEKERRVELLSGEAFFSVEKDESRPFVVNVGDAEIRVVGTKFDVRRSEGGVQVSVLEGIVEVIQNHEKQENGVIIPVVTRTTIKAEEKIKAMSDGQLTEIQPVLPERLAPWRKGRLYYENASLSEVIADADRYYDGNIILDTDDLRELPVSAAFRTDQIQEMMDTLSIVLPVTAKTLSNGDIVIRRRDNHRG